MIKPSELMRARKPHLYSDSKRVDEYRLSKSEFTSHLDTLTDRNQHKDFEVFCLHLCEAEICPNLTPQTGPEGGGDGKIDTETYPVDEAISERWYVGNSSGNKRWGFAFSTKKAWKSKIEADVEGAVGTGRVYDRIYCITSRPIPQRKRLDLEKALTDKHGVSVHIFDREWIIERVFQNHHKALAWEYLRAGAHEPDKLEDGPRDFRRKQAFKEIEARFIGLGSKPHERLQAVTDAFDLAQLSRELERPRNETSQRFELAIIQAEKYGIGVQLLRATYEYAWTKLWWFDDFDAMQSDYEKVEELAFATGEAAHISKVCNLHQILVGQIFRGEEFKEGLNFDVRSGRLKAKLTELSSDQTRPNNALYAEVLLIFHQMNEKLLASKVDDLDEIWNSISKVIDRSQGMGEFPVDFVSDYVSELSKLLPDSRAFDALIEKLTDFVGERGQEIASGEMLLEQGENKLERDKCLEAIRWLGRAVVLLAKEETRDQQARALYLLSVAYRCAGLLWAARSTVLAAIIPNLALSELESKIRVETIPTVLLFTRISLELGHVADF